MQWQKEQAFPVMQMHLMEVVDGAKSFIGTAGTFVGAIWVIAAVFTLVMAIRNEDNEGRNKALLNVVCGGVLCSLSLILALFFNSNS